MVDPGDEELLPTDAPIPDDAGYVDDAPDEPPPASVPQSDEETPKNDSVPEGGDA